MTSPTITVNGTRYKLMPLNRRDAMSKQDACCGCVAKESEPLCNQLAPHCRLDAVFALIK